MPKGSPPIARAVGTTRAGLSRRRSKRSPATGRRMALVQRVENFQANPPAADWDGAWRLDQK